MVILHARGVIKPEARERWLAVLDAVMPPSRAFNSESDIADTTTSLIANTDVQHH
jgi:hypothetical protein